MAVNRRKTSGTDDLYLFGIRFYPASHPSKHHLYDREHKHECGMGIALPSTRSVPFFPTFLLIERSWWG